MYWIIFGLLYLRYITSQTREIKYNEVKKATGLNNRYIVILGKGNTRTSSLSLNSLDQHLKGVRALIRISRMSRSANKTMIDDHIKHVYRSSAILGYSGLFNEDIIKKVKGMKEVALVEPDSVAKASLLSLPISLTMQPNPPWGLARLSSRNRITDRRIPDYLYDKSSGKDATAYIIDSGININHHDFEGRARWGINLVSNSEDIDENGHGTHVAGTIGSRTFGVAKQVELVAVKVLDSEGSGSTSDIIAGIDWVLQDSQSRGGSKGSVANLSLGGSRSRAFNMAADRAVKAGLTMVVAAGNENNDACGHSPASANLVISIGSTNLRDRRSEFSNVGKCVTLFAPGENIKSTYIGSRSATKILSGTSMAAPHVAGLIASFMSRSPKRLTTKQIYSQLMEAATPNIINQLDSRSPNLLAYNLAQAPSSLEDPEDLFDPEDD